MTVNSDIQFSVPGAVLLICRVLREYGYEALMVGGCVRDQWLGLQPNDYDITTNCLPDETMRIFADKGFRVIPVGLKHGTISVLVDDVPYEITTYRSESIYTDGRHPDQVHFLKDLKGDLERRDFTINAMAYDPVEQRLVDYFDGIGDMRRKLIRAVGDPDKRLAEDFLRMLRAIRYAARFSCSIEPATFYAIKAHAGKIGLISKERILSEFVKMAGESGSRFADALKLLKECGLLKEILPEIDIMDRFEHDSDSHPEGGVWLHTLAALCQNMESDSILNLAILFHDVGKPLTFTEEGGRIRYNAHHQAGADLIEDIARRFKMSGEHKAALKFVAFHHMKFHGILAVSNHKLIQLIENPFWTVLYRTAWCDDASRGEIDHVLWQKIDERVAALHQKYIEQKQLEEIRKVVNGQLIMAIKGIPPSPEVGEYIRLTVEWILNEAVDIADKTKIEQYIKNVKLQKND